MMVKGFKAEKFVSRCFQRMKKVSVVYGCLSGTDQKACYRQPHDM